DAGMRALARSTTLVDLTELIAEKVPARPDLIEAATIRFRERRPPLADRPPPLPASVAQSRVVGQGDEDALVRAILANPWDTLARSAYADWFEEQGKP